MRRYTRLDLIRFHRFAQERTDERPFDLVKAYNEAYPEKSSKEQLVNMSKALGLNGLHKAITGQDIPEDERFFDDHNEEE